MVTDTVPGAVAFTVRGADAPEMFSIVAMMMAVPCVTPVTTPLALTVATDGLFDDHTGAARPVSTDPEMSSGVAVAVTVCPAKTVVALSVTRTDATVPPRTVSVAGALVTPSTVAEMLVVPAATAVTRPVALTVATAVLLELQADTVRPVRTFP